MTAEHIDVKTRKQRGGDAGAVGATIGPNAKFVVHPQSKGKTAGLPRTAKLLCQFLEFGTRHQGKKPFLTSAFMSSRNAALDKIIETLRERLRRYFQ